MGIPQDCFNLLPFGAGIKCPVYSAYDLAFKWPLIIAHVLGADFLGHSVFSASHCALTIIDLRRQRVKVQCQITSMSSTLCDILDDLGGFTTVGNIISNLELSFTSGSSNNQPVDSNICNNYTNG